MDDKISYFNKMFENIEESESAIYNTWKALKIASLCARDRDALDITPAAHKKNPKN